MVCFCNNERERIFSSQCTSVLTLLEEMYRHVLTNVYDFALPLLLFAFYRFDSFMCLCVCICNYFQFALSLQTPPLATVHWLVRSNIVFHTTNKLNFIVCLYTSRCVGNIIVCLYFVNSFSLSLALCSLKLFKC